MLEKLPDALGHALADVRAGLDKTLFQAVDLRQRLGAITVGSLAFADHAPLPVRCTADGEGLSPPLHWSGVPAMATQVVVVVEDADSPTPHPLVHAIAVGLPADEGGALAEGAMGGKDAEPTVSMGRNSYLRNGWLPPDPPPGHGAHRYVFQVFALGPGAPLDAPGRDALRDALEERAIASGCLIGTYERDGSVAERSVAPGLAVRDADAS
jgi:Raf kinase inhibitor-like YbhB/YbcL family protein